MYQFIAQAIGFVGTILCIGCFQFKKGSALILLQLAGNLAFVVHYIMLGAYSGCVSIMLSALSNFILLLGMKGHHWAAWKGWKWVLSLLMAMACLAVWQDLFSILPCAASVAFVLTNWSGNTKVMRTGKLALVGPGWILYNIHACSYSGIVTELIGMISAGIALYRYNRGGSV